MLAQRASRDGAVGNRARPAGATESRGVKPPFEDCPPGIHIHSGNMAKAEASMKLDPLLDDYPMVGETLGIWRLLTGVGRGGMGEVYEAEYDFIHLLSLGCKPEERGLLKIDLVDCSRQELARMASEMLGTALSAEARFAIKICTGRNGTSGYKRFLQEADWAQELGVHPYIVTVHAVHGRQAEDEARLPLERGKYREVAFMVMDMASRDYDHTELAIPQAVHVVRCIATALDHAHSRGVVHRDLKPENILGSVDYPLLTDFGIAKELDHTLGLTRTGQVIGTLDYMSPEQATDAKRVDRRSDVYSLGVVLYEFATKGCLPYYHLNEREECLAAIRSERTEPRWPRYYVSDFPRELEYIILKAMAHAPDERYQSMNEFITDLDRYSRGERLGWWGRVRFLRFVHYWRKEKPQLVWGGPAVLTALLILLLTIWAPRWLDNTYHILRDRTTLLEEWVEEIRSGHGQQLDREQEKLLREVGNDLVRQGDHYPRLAQRYRLLSQRLDEQRRLHARFTDQEHYKDALREFELAVVEGNQDWRLVDTSHERGLAMQSDVTVRTKTYGLGLVYCHIRLRTVPGFSLVVEEADNPRHRTVLALSGNELRLSLRTDEAEARELMRHQLPGQAGPVLLDLGLLVSDQGVRLWTGKPDEFRAIPALREQAPARIQLKLPQGSLLEQIGVWPEEP
jgi:serine/threonine protein kinase